MVTPKDRLKLKSMKRLIFALGILFIYSCTKTETTTTTPPVTIVQEEAIKFTTNLDTGTYNVADTLPLTISVSSKLPSAGLIYSITATWTDSSKQIYKLDTSLSQSTLNLNIPGFKNTGNYSLYINVASKSTSSNTQNKSISIVNNPLNRFMGYKVAINARQLGTNYWTNTGVMGDLMIAAYQKGVNRTNYGTFFDGFAYGDLNNDGYVDIFNPGQFYIQTQAKFSFLIWNPTTKNFDDKNLFNDKSFTEFGRNKGKTIPVFLNNDNYVDFVISDMGDESNSTGSNIEPIRIVISDGNGGYDLKSIITNEFDSVLMIDKKVSIAGTKEGIAIGDLNGDGLPDMVMSSNNNMFIYWGIVSSPYFTLQNHATFIYDESNFGKISDNSFGEKAKYCAGGHRFKIFDINKDGKNDIISFSEDPNSMPTPKHNKVLLNLGGGKFNNSSVITLPDFDPTTSTGVEDACFDDLNGDGLLDIITISHNPNYRNWTPFVYLQQSNGNFIVDNTYFQFTINTNRVDDFNWKPEIIYFDFDGDGKKDIGYRNSADNPGFMKKKTVFIRTGNKFIEKDFYQFDPYAKSILSKVN